MARTFQEILTAVNEEQANYPELNELDSPSEVSFWRLLKNMFANLQLVLENGFDKYRSEIDALIIAQQIGTLPWYVDQVKKFQFGETLQVVDNKIGYANIVEEALIIAQAAVSEVVESGRAKLVIKAVKSNDSGVREPLSIDQYDALEEYISKVKFAGVTVDLRSVAADNIRLNMTIEINRLMLADDGSSLTDPDIFPVEDAIKNYFASLPFDGRLYWTKLIDHLQAMPEVLDAVVTASWYDAGSSSFVSFTRFYDSYSGHLLLHNTSVITYV